MKKWMKKFSAAVLLVFITALLFGCNLSKNNNIENVNSDNKKVSQNRNVDKNIINDFQGVADYIHTYNKLPDNFITKDEAMKLGWHPGDDLSKKAPGKSIGGDVFTNAERKLPQKKGRLWHECDINYTHGARGTYRIVFSNDGMIYKTSDHYNTFTRIY